MAKAVINLQKESGGIVKISPVDGTGVTEVTVPESGNLVSVDAAVTDNAIARYDGTTGKLQNSGVVIDDNGKMDLNKNSDIIGVLGRKSDSNMHLEIGANGVIDSTSQITMGWSTDKTYAPVAIVAQNKNGNGSTYSDLVFATRSTNTDVAPTERMRIDANGNVGIGVTPSAWHGGYTHAIEIGSATDNGTIWSSLHEQHSHIGIGANFYMDSSFTPRYKASYAASQYSQSIGKHYWFTAPSGTAGDAITWTNAMTLDSSGSLNVGVYGSAYHNFRKNVTLNAGNPIFEIAESGSGNGWSAFIAYGVGAFGANSSNCAVRIGKDAITGRSINAGGTINASGADYAEYEYSNDITLVKGQIVGFKADGTLTDMYNESVRFAIKSTNPSIVGGDTWGIEEIVGKRPEKHVKSEEMTDEEFAELEELYELELADFETRLEVERQKVDRIAYAGKVPVNVYGAVPGQYVVAVEKDGGIDGKLVNKSDMTFAEYQDAVGRVNKILDDGRAEVAVIIH